MDNKECISVESKTFSLKSLFSDRFVVDFYQREYVWTRKQIEDLIIDLSSAFIKNYDTKGHDTSDVESYDPYFMGEIVISTKAGEKSAVIDGQQRITTLTLLLIYLERTYDYLPGFPTDIQSLIYSDHFGKMSFNLDIPERRECMQSLLSSGSYIVPKDSLPSVDNLVNRYADISECWDKRINESNVIPFVYWIKEKVMFSKVWTTSDEFAYLIFETMNDRGLSLTQVEMLRSLLLANIKDDDKRKKSMDEYDTVVRKLSQIKLSSKSKAEFEFFKMYLRAHYAEDLSQKNTTSDFVRIGKEFHRWVNDNSKSNSLLSLISSDDYVEFIHKIHFYADVYIRIDELITQRKTKDYLYLVVNSDYGFTMQPAVIMAAIAYKDTEETIDEKIKLISEYLTKELTKRVWNHAVISQSALEDKTYSLCKAIRGLNVDSIKTILTKDFFDFSDLSGTPVLNQQNRRKFCVMLSLITAIVGKESNDFYYPLDDDNIEVEHIWADHYERHLDEFSNEESFRNVRNSLGDLLVLPKSFNASYGDKTYEEKVEQYFSQNILAQSLNAKKYDNNPGFIRYKNESGLSFKPYEMFTSDSIKERTDLYRSILKNDWK